MIGLDISSSSVKLVELGQTGSGEYVLERFGSESFEKGWISDGQIEKFDEVAEAVKRLVTKSGTKTRQVVMAMPQSAVITKKIMLPAACAKRSSRSRSRPSQSVHPVLARRGQPRFLRHRPEPDLGR